MVKLDRKVDPLHSTLAIDSDREIPMPSFGRRIIYPIRYMEVGDSFFVPCKTPEDFNRVRSSSYSSARRHSIKVTIRIVNEEGVDGLRVWRVE